LFAKIKYYSRKGKLENKLKKFEKFQQTALDTDVST